MFPFCAAIARVGLYVPGGTAILPSTALMLGIPAQVAGCKEVVLATPPRPDGSVSPEVMYVAKLVGASAVLMAGGAQAVAALAYGTETVPKVDKIFGPGNQWGDRCEDACTERHGRPRVYRHACWTVGSSCKYHSLICYKFSVVTDKLQR